MEKPVSIIVRTKNEERWMTACLHSVFNQEFKDFEVIIVDNGSTDRTLEKAKQFDIRIMNIEEYTPGKAINTGIRASSGKYIVCLSGHCIPVNNQWLTNLVKNVELPDVAGVYGRQESLSFSSDFDKRDLLITFGLDRKIQTKDSFFHNANSIIKRSAWKEIPFDEQITNIEDRIWAREVLRHGYKIIYEPDASVYHYHGIHQNGDQERCRRVVEILETLELNSSNKIIDVNNLKVASIIPIKGKVDYLGNRSLIEYTLKRSLEAKYINYTVVATDNADTIDLSKKAGADFVLLRPPGLSAEYIEIQDVLKYAVDELEKLGVIPDIIVYLSITNPFRPKYLIDTVITQLVKGGYDSTLPTIAEYRSCWFEETGQIRRVDKGFIPSQFKEPVHIGISGLGTATYVDIIRSGDRLGQKVGIVELDDFIYSIDVGKTGGFKLASLIIEDWWRNES